MIYILNKDGKPLMPSTRYRHIKQLIKSGKAVKISSKPYTVKLLYQTPDITQPLICGIDPGRTNIGISVITESGTPVYEAQVGTRNKDIPRLMQKRKAFRRNHRLHKRREKRRRRARAAGTIAKNGYIDRLLPGYKEPRRFFDIRNKEQRYNNRKYPKGWLTPTARHLLLTHLNIIRKISKILPISAVVLEVNKFSFMAMDNPHIQKWQYRRGPLYGYGSVENALFEQQDGHCIFCKKRIDHYHHIIPRSKGGGETIANRVGLCEQHHRLVHTDQAWTDKLAAKKDGLNKKYGALNILNQIIPFLLQKLGVMFPGQAYATDGKSTAAFRQDNQVPKDHYLDAYCIACSILMNPKVQKTHDKPFQILQFRRHDRRACNKEMVNRQYLLEGKIVATNRHKALEQKTDSLEEYVAKGGRTDNLTVKPHPTTYRNMNRILPGATFWVNNEPKIMTGSMTETNKSRKGTRIRIRYLFLDGSKAEEKNCTFVRQNTGLVYV